MKREYIVVLRVLLCLLVCTAVTGVFSLSGTPYYGPIETAIAASGANTLGGSQLSGSTVQLRFQDTPKPTAVAEQLAAESDDPREVVLSAEGSTVADESAALDATIVAYEWDFGDGDGWVTAILSPGDPPWLAYHNYDDYGVYQVKLRVTDTFGADDEFTIDVLAIRVIDGPPDESALDYLPDLPFPPPAPEDYIVMDGFCISTRDMVVSISDTATVEEVNEQLYSLRASIIGSEPITGLALLWINTNSICDLSDAAAQLRDAGVVKFALNDMGGTAQSLSAGHDDQPSWKWTVPDYGSNTPSASGGNWGLELIRAPQMWNLDTWVRRNKKATQISALIMDESIDSAHSDLNPIINSLTSNAKKPSYPDHGTMIAGIIGAQHDNAEGVEGICPWIDSICFKRLSFISDDLNTWGRELDGIVDALKKNTEVRAVNCSYGLAAHYEASCITPDTSLFGYYSGIPFCPVDLNGDGCCDTWAEVVDCWGKLYYDDVSAYATSKKETNTARAGRFILVSSAGNYSCPLPAVYNSPISNAAIRYQSRFLAVESTNDQKVISCFSGTSGSNSAPGESLFSTTFGSTYGSGSGTSYAAPHVAALVCCLWILDETLTVDQVRTLLTDGQYTRTVTNGANLVDAFAAATGIDNITGSGSKTLQAALVDVDDGTYDGNLRVDPFAGTQITTVMTSDNLRGDGVVSMRDFRAWRDAYLAAHTDAIKSSGCGLVVKLDGDPTHFKKDYNFDGVIGVRAVKPPHPTGITPSAPSLSFAPDELEFSRYDFNGDGTIGNASGTAAIDDWTINAPFCIDPDPAASAALKNPKFDFVQTPDMVRDIDVLASTGNWQTYDNLVSSLGSTVPYYENVVVDIGQAGVTATTGGWSPNAFLLQDKDQKLSVDPFFQTTPDYIHSCDLHLLPDWNALGASASLTIKISSEVVSSWAGTDDRYATFTSNDPEILILTVPIWTGNIRISYSVNGVLKQTQICSGIQLGEDKAISIPWS